MDAKGEIASLAETINGMIETLATFADQVTNVAREVGIEGKLGGQARVPGAAGLWRDLTDNVNQLAANLTTQVRAIAEVSTAVTKGDLTRSITVEASGEVAALKDNINEMIRNLKDQTLKNTEQDWLKTNLARFTRMLQGERDLSTVSNMVLSELAPLVNAQHGVFYVTEQDEDGVYLNLAASYAFTHRKHLANRFKLREGLIGQCAYEKSRILLTNVPPDYVQISSGLGEAPPMNVIVLPVLFEGEVNAVIELASFSQFSETHQSFLDQLMESIGIVLNTIAANMRTEGLLKQSQLLTSELQAQQEELKKTNDRLEQQANTLRQSEELLAPSRTNCSSHQRGAGGKGDAALDAERPGRGEEPRGRAGQAGAGRQGRTARADLEVQVRVPGQHEPRAADAAQQPADPVEAAVRQQPGQSHREAGRVLPHHPPRRFRPARPDQRHPRPVQDRIRHGHAGHRRDRVRIAARAHGPHLRPAGPGQEARLLGRSRSGAAAGDSHRRQAPAAGHQEPAVQRLQVHREGPRQAADRQGDVGLVRGQRRC